MEVNIFEPFLHVGSRVKCLVYVLIQYFGPLLVFPILQVRDPSSVIHCHN